MRFRMAGSARRGVVRPGAGDGVDVGVGAEVDAGEGAVAGVIMTSPDLSVKEAVREGAGWAGVVWAGTTTMTPSLLGAPVMALSPPGPTC